MFECLHPDLSAQFVLFDFVYMFEKPVPVAARFKAWVCGCSPAKIVGLNPTGDMDVCLL